MSLPDELRTRRLRLRPSRPEDAAEVFRAWAGDAGICRFLDWAPRADVGATEELLREFAADRASGAAQDWLAERLEDGALVGAARLAWHAPFAREVGFLVAPKAQGRGLGSEIVSEITERALALPGVHRLQAECHPGNVASLRVLEACGYEVEGRLRRCRLFPNLDDEAQDLLLLSRLS